MNTEIQIGIFQIVLNIKFFTCFYTRPILLFILLPIHIYIHIYVRESNKVTQKRCIYIHMSESTKGLNKIV